jgi:dienelactone hydrolase
MDDQMWPSSELADIAVRRLEAHRHPYPFRHLTYPGAGHTIIVPYWPLTVRSISLRVQGLAGYLLSQGGTPKADAEAGVDAWRNTLEFLHDSAEGRR